MFQHCNHEVDIEVKCQIVQFPERFSQELIVQCCYNQNMKLKIFLFSLFFFCDILLASDILDYDVFSLWLKQHFKRFKTDWNRRRRPFNGASNNLKNSNVSIRSDCLCGKTGEILTRIVGGQPATKNEYPWQVGMVTPSGSRPFCGGSLITSNTVLTAAHCQMDVNRFLISE